MTLNAHGTRLTATGRRRLLVRWTALRCCFCACFLIALALSPAISAQEPVNWQQEVQRLQMQIDELKSGHVNVLEDTERGLVVPAGHSVGAPLTPFCPDGQHAALTGRATQNAFPTARLTGFLQVDSGWFSQDSGNMAALGDIQDGADFRRARLAAVGDAWDNVSYMLEMDFGFPGRPSFMDVWLQLNDVANGSARVGQFRIPFGMDGQTSVKELTFLERGLPFAFRFGRLEQCIRRDPLTKT